MEEPKKKSFADRFQEAFQKSMREEAAELERLPKVFKPGEGLVDVVDPDDRHMGT